MSYAIWLNLFKLDWKEISSLAFFNREEQAKEVHFEYDESIEWDMFSETRYYRWSENWKDFWMIKKSLFTGSDLENEYWMAEC